MPLASDPNLSALDIALEDLAAEHGEAFAPPPPPAAMRAAKLVGVALLDRRLRYRRIDAALAAMYGRSVGQCLGRTPAELAPDLAAALEPARRRVLETGEPALSLPLGENAAPRGRRRLVSYFPLPPSEKELRDHADDPAEPPAAGLVAVVREVDAELTSRPRGVSDERFRELVTRATVGIAQVDPAGRFLYVNDRFCQITGWRRWELVGDPPGTGRTQQQITHPRDAGANEAKFGRAVAAGDSYLIDKRYRRPDGRSVWVRNTVTVLPDPHGNTESVFAVTVDMTDRVRTERALKRSDDRLRLALEAGGLGVWAFDLEKGRPDWSPEALAIFGGGFDGRPTMQDLRDRVHPRDWPRLAAATVEAAGEDPHRIDLTHRVLLPAGDGDERGAEPTGAGTAGAGTAGAGTAGEPDGEPAVRWVRSQGEVRFGRDGRPVRSVGVLRDVTADHAAAGRLEASERRLRQALAAADLGAWEFDAATGLSDWDRRTADLFGLLDRWEAGQRLFTHDEMLAAIHPEDRARIAAAIPETLDPAGDGRYDVEHRVVGPDGVVRRLSILGEAEFEGTGADRRAVRVTGTARDVTQMFERERRLAESEGRLRLAVGAAKLGMYEYDLHTDDLWWDDRCREIFDYEPGAGGAGRDSADGTPIPLAEGMGRIHPADAPAVAARVEAARAAAERDGVERGGGRVGLHLDYRVVRRDGTHTHVRSDGEVRAEPPAGDRPGTLRLIGCLRDVTAEVERERRLAENEERLRLAAEAVELGAYDVDLRAGTVWWDDRLRTMYGVPGAAETVPLAGAFARVHPDDRAAVERAMAQAHASGAPPRFRYDYRVRRPDGTIRWCRAHGSARFEEVDGTRTAVRQTGYVQDVTAEKRREQADAAHAAELAARARETAEAEERRRLAATAARLGAFDFDPRTGEIWWDERARELFDLPDETLDIEAALARIHPHDRPAVEAVLAAVLAGEQSPRFSHEYRVVRPDGSVRWLRSYDEARFESVPGADGGGEPAREAVRVVGCLQDVTDRKRAEIALAEAKARLETENDRLEAAVADRTARLREQAAQLRAAAERLGEVARQERDRIAHVLHDHLQQILVGAKMNLAALTASPDGNVAETARRVSGFIDDAIGESRSLAVELVPPILRTAGLCPALDWLADRTRERHELAVTVACDEALSDRLPVPLATLLFEATRECLLNVVKHARAGAAAVAVETADDGAAVLLSVCDDGVGYDPAAVGGDGFGMSDLRQRVDLLGGTVAVRSLPGAGCTVRFRLPVPAP